MLAMAEETDDGFLAGKVVADFGCGPQGVGRCIRDGAHRSQPAFPG
jgi:hypothetical protein